MAETDVLVDLESTIEAFEEVLGSVILADSSGHPTEIQAFTRTGSDLESVRRRIVAEVARLGLQDHLSKIFVFELEAESHFGDRESLERAAELAEQEALSRGPLSVVPERTTGPAPRKAAADGAPRPKRPMLQRVMLGSTSGEEADAEVVLGPEGREVVGQARGEKTPHNLRVLAQATLEAATKLVTDVDFQLVGASLVTVLGREAILVIVADDGLETIGGALVRNGPLTEAAVRATLDAINRRLTEL